MSQGSVFTRERSLFFVALIRYTDRSVQLVQIGPHIRCLPIKLDDFGKPDGAICGHDEGSSQ